MIWTDLWICPGDHGYLLDRGAAAARDAVAGQIAAIDAIAQRVLAR